MGSVAGQTLYPLPNRYSEERVWSNSDKQRIKASSEKMYPMNVIKGHSCTFVGFVARKVSSGNRTASLEVITDENTGTIHRSMNDNSLSTLI